MKEEWKTSPWPCGTGTASVVVALKERGRTDGKDVPVQVPGGTLTIDIEEDGVYLSGPTEGSI